MSLISVALLLDRSADNIPVRVRLQQEESGDILALSIRPRDDAADGIEVHCSPAQLDRLGQIIRKSMQEYYHLKMQQQQDLQEEKPAAAETPPAPTPISRPRNRSRSSRKDS